MRLAGILAGIIIIPALAAAAGRCDVAVRVTNGAGRTVRMSGPANLTAEVRVPPKADNRVLVITWDYAPVGMMGPATDEAPEFAQLDSYDGAIGSAEIALEGAAARLRHDRVMNGLSGGTYEVTAIVYRDAQKKRVCGSARTTVRVLGR